MMISYTRSLRKLPAIPTARLSRQADNLSTIQHRYIHTPLRREKIVFLDGHVPPPDFSFACQIQRYPKTSPLEVADRIRDATIVCTATCSLSRESLRHATSLRLVACLGTGSDHIDHAFLRERGISLCNVPSQNSESVAEHAIALHLALQRNIVAMDSAVRDGPQLVDRAVKNMASLRLRVSKEHVAGIVGYGSIGQHIASIANALGMRVIIAERKHALSVRPGRVPFETMLRMCTTLFIACPLTDSSRHMISQHELSTMQPEAAIVNVARGDVVDHAALEEALRSGLLSGYATDVLEHRTDQSKDNSLMGLDTPNVIMTPHVAWLSSSSLRKMREVLRANIEGFVSGQPQNVLIPPWQPQLVQADHKRAV